MINMIGLYTPMIYSCMYSIVSYWIEHAMVLLAVWITCWKHESMKADETRKYICNYTSSYYTNNLLLNALSISHRFLALSEVIQ